MLVVVRGRLGIGGVRVPDDFEFEGVRGLHRREDGLGDQLVGREGFAGQDDLVGWEVTARGDGRDPAALNILPQDLQLVGSGELEVTRAGEADAQVVGVDERVKVGDDRQPGRDPLGVVQPARELLLAERAVRLPVGGEIATNGWTTQTGRLSQLVPAVHPLCLQPGHVPSPRSRCLGRPYPTRFRSPGKG
jgi:hypothetical protein